MQKTAIAAEGRLQKGGRKKRAGWTQRGEKRRRGDRFVSDR